MQLRRRRRVPCDGLQNKRPVPAPVHARLFQETKQVSGFGGVVTLFGQVPDKAGLVSNTLLPLGDVPVR